MSAGHQDRTEDRIHLDRAARIALRGHGRVEPNPLVGCVVLDAEGRVVAEGHHRRCGEAHAERIALTRAGERARGGTLYCTLEPCAHQGRTPPCTEAIIESGIARVVFGTVDPFPPAAGGAAVLEAAGIEVDRFETPATARVSAPFVHRVRTGLPWIVAKWAQTLDGRIATASGDSRWISSARSRRLVHRERGRVDAVMTGIGTVLADDPDLTPRDVRTPWRRPERIVVDDDLRTSPEARLVRTAGETTTLILCRREAARTDRADRLRERGVLLHEIPDDGTLREALHRLASERGLATILVEAGGGLLGRLFREDLVNDALVFTAPRLLGDASAPGAVRGFEPSRIADGIELDRLCAFPRNADLLAWYRFRGRERPE